MAVNAELAADGAADIHVASFFDIVAHFLSAQTYGVKTHVVDFVGSEAVVLEIADESRMRSLKCQTVGVHKRFSVVGELFHPKYHMAFRIDHCR